MKPKEYKYKINGIKFNVAVGEVVDNMVRVEVNGTPYMVELEGSQPLKSSLTAPIKPAAAAPRTQTGEKVISKPAAAPGSPDAVKSPLPGTIMSFKVSEGQQVKAGDTVCVLEAMKMENDIHTNKGGTVKKILVNVGDAVLEGADIMIIE